jgi:hypothetical protein
MSGEATAGNAGPGRGFDSTEGGARISTDGDAFVQRPLSGPRVGIVRRLSAWAGRHWRGELSLPVSFWLNNVLLPVPLGTLVGGLMAWISLRGEQMPAGSVAVLVGWPLMIALDVWCGVGAWRSAGQHRDRGGAGLWAILARVVVGLGLVGTVASAVFNFGPRVGELVQMARGIDPLGRLEMALSPDGRRLKLSGTVGMGDATRLQAMVAAAPQVRVLEMQSPGGRVFEAERIARIVQDRGWRTRATGPCESACTLIFLAGSSRQLMADGRLGFHRASTGTFNPVLDQVANHELSAMYRRAGLPEEFVGKAARTPSWRMWYPGPGELTASGLVRLPSGTLDIDLPPLAQSQPVDIVDALETNDTWQALDKRFPGAIAQAAARTQAARTAGAADADALVDGQRVVEALLPALLANAGPEIREQFMQLLGAQLAAVQGEGGAACRRLLSGDAALRRTLPREIVTREAAWLADASAEPPREGAAKPLTTIELEVLRRRLGDRAPALLAGLMRPAGAASARDCDKTQALIIEIARLPAPERRLATRLALDRR